MEIKISLKPVSNRWLRVSIGTSCASVFGSCCLCILLLCVAGHITLRNCAGTLSEVALVSVCSEPINRYQRQPCAER
jgi:hypothetical protein